MKSNIVFISNRTGGRLGNQLFFVLQAFCKSNRLNVPVKYTQIETVAPQTELSQIANHLNIRKYYVEYSPEMNIQLMPINKHYGHINDDFSEEELLQFIKETLLQSTVLKEFQMNMKYDIESTVSIHIRNGDFLNLSFHNCFNRKEYLKKALSYFKDIKEFHIFSDDNSINRQEYSAIFSECFPKSQFIFIDEPDPVSSLFRMSLYKNRILWNSTFSFWSTYLSTAIFEKNNMLCVCPYKSVENDLSQNTGLDTWIYV